MVKKQDRIRNEYPWHPDRMEAPSFSEGIDHIKSIYRDTCYSYHGWDDERVYNWLSLAHRIPSEIINDILINIEYLDDDCDAALYSAKLSRWEYYGVMKPVGRVALELRQDGLTDTEIRPWITKLVKGMLDEREKCGRIVLKPWFLEWDALIGYRKKVFKTSAKPSRTPTKKIFSYSSGVTSALYGPKTVEEIQEYFYQTIRDLSNLPEIDPNAFEFFRKGLIQAVCDLGKIGVSLKDLEKDHTQEVADGNTD
jgi:hypothetical protein